MGTITRRRFLQLTGIVATGLLVNTTRPSDNLPLLDVSISMLLATAFLPDNRDGDWELSLAYGTRPKQRKQYPEEFLAVYSSNRLRLLNYHAENTVVTTPLDGDIGVALCSEGEFNVLSDGRSLHLLGQAPTLLDLYTNILDYRIATFRCTEERKTPGPDASGREFFASRSTYSGYFEPLSVAANLHPTTSGFKVDLRVFHGARDPLHLFGNYRPRTDFSPIRSGSTVL